MAQPQFSCTTANSYKHLLRGPPRSLEQRHLGDGNRGSATHVLRGYDCYFLNMRSITFVEPLPSVRVCAGCSVVPARAVHLPCGHTLCEICEYDAFVRPTAQLHRDASAVERHRGGLCPVDGTCFAESEVNVLTFPLAQLHHQRAFCVNRRFGCAFEAELRHIKEHSLTECCIRRKICRRCGRDNILACDTRQHSRRCSPL